MVATDLTNIINRVQQMADPDYERARNRIEYYFNNGVREQFQSEGNRFDTPWHPLQPDYAYWKIRHGHNGGILVLTGQMRHDACQGEATVERTWYGAVITYGTGRNWLIPIHHYGVPQHNLPSRPILNLTRHDLGMIRAFIMEEYLG